ncbi:MAG: AMIN domain-containing protein, partial [Myxococcota bacterium]|nr:AMIN domain-containing protein [Myxococcota bacterium]
MKTESIDFGVDGMPAALQSGTVLMAVDIEPGRDGALIHFHADGELALARTFVLDNPNRLVVDLPGIRGDLSSNEFVLGGQFVVGVRVGKHPDKLRVVIDGADDVEAFSEYKAFPSRDGLYVVIGADPQLEMRLDARLNGSGMPLGLADSEILPGGADEPVMVAMNSADGEPVGGNPWDKEVGTPDDAEILARISDPYMAEQDA